MHSSCPWKAAEDADWTSSVCEKLARHGVDELACMGSVRQAEPTVTVRPPDPRCADRISPARDCSGPYLHHLSD